MKSGSYEDERRARRGKTLSFIDLVKALHRIKCWEYMRIEDIQYHIKSDTNVVRNIGKSNKNISINRGHRGSLCLALTRIDIGNAYQIRGSCRTKTKHNYSVIFLYYLQI
jgi:hypothetical protein